MELNAKIILQVDGFYEVEFESLIENKEDIDNLLWGVRNTLKEDLIQENGSYEEW